MSNNQVIDRMIERKIEDYHSRYLSPSPATIKNWRRNIARQLDNKNQLPLPLIFIDEKGSNNDQ